MVASAGLTARPGAQELFILAEGGGDNGSRPRAWKKALQHTICNSLGPRLPSAITLLVAPSGIPSNIAYSARSVETGRASLTDIDKALNFVRTASNTTGLVVTAQLIAGSIVKGIRVTGSEMRTVSRQRHDSLGRWNYTLQPIKIVARDAAGRGAFAPFAWPAPFERPQFHCGQGQRM